jgi:lycopene beta-cyclase
VANDFDYIIAGGGMAGLSLAFYLNVSRLRDKKTLIVDRDAKNENDHTWCFWETGEGAFEKQVFRRWQGVWFHGTRGFSGFLDLGEYEYKMIRAAPFYEFVLEKIKANPNFRFLQAEIKSIEYESVKTDQGEFRAKEFIFDSFTRKTYDNPKYQNLWQHFHGWLIETEAEAFRPDEPTLFDFRVEQAGDCRFVYILPFSEKKALIEFTVFSESLLKQYEYEENLGKYISKILKIERYKTLETEAGVIPMSDEPHEEFPTQKTIRIGTAGGYVKPSTGYSFQRTQRRLQQLVENLENQIPNPKSQIPNWKGYLDSVLLNVFLTKKHAADDVFTCLFAKNKPEQILKFLDEDTTFAEDLRIMKTVPRTAFTKAAVRTAVKKFEIIFSGSYN